MAAVVLGLGLIMLAFPMRTVPPRWLVVGGAVLVLWPLAGLMPAGPLAAEGWRARLEAGGGLDLGWLHSVQPWLTLEAAVVAGCFMVWAVYLTGQPLNERQRVGWMGVHVGTLAVVAAVALFAHGTDTAVPGWPEDRFGPFPNRNQTANVFALAGVLGVALGLRQLRHGHRSGWAWLGVAVILLGAVLVNGSRAGLILFLAGCGWWTAWVAQGGRGKSWMGGAVTALLLLAALALLLGGPALERVLDSSRTPQGWTEDARVAVQRDAWAMTMDHPVRGVGLASFEGVFAFYRNHYQGTARVIHPESDWLWLAGEAGWPAVVVLAVLVGVGLWYCLPRPGAGERRLRQAALVGAGLFLAHSLIDVPGHRAGSLLAGLAMIPLAWPATGAAAAGVRFRAFGAVAGLGVTLCGVVLAAQAAGRLDPPTQLRKARLLEECLAYDRAGLHHEVINAAAAGIRLAPLEWRFHFHSARARLRTNVGWAQARREFRRARLLEPDDPMTPFQEGALWLGRDEDLVVEAWAEAMRRTDRPVELFRRMLGLAEGRAGLIERMEALTVGRPELDFFFLAKVSEEVFEQRLKSLLARTPEEAGLRPEDAHAFFTAWRERRGDARFVAELATHPAWEAVGWPWAALVHGNAGRWEEALALTDRYLARPAMPPPAEDRVRARQRLMRHPDDLPAGFALAAAEAAAGNWAEAARLLEPLSRQKEVPAYVFYALAEARRRDGDPRGGWQAMSLYLQLRPPERR